MPADDHGRVALCEVWSVGEFRAVLVSTGLSVLGDQVARIAVALLVFARTGSALASSATYACSYLTWLVGGPVLSALADRHLRRRLMVVCDVLRAAVVALLVLPAPPLWLVFAVLVVAGLLSPPFDAAKGALLPDLLEGDRYVAGNAVINAVNQGGQAVGFLVGGVLVAAVGTRWALGLDALTFALSALVLAAWVRERPRHAPARSRLLGDVRAGVRMVLSDPLLRRMLGIGLLVAFVAIVPEGMAVPVAHHLGGGNMTAGVLTAAGPAGFLLGSFLVLRVPVARRLALLPRLVALTCAPLLLTPLAPSSAVVAMLWLVSGGGAAAQLVANATYMTSVAPAARGRALGVAISALMAVQGVALLSAGALAQVLGPRRTVLAAGLVGLLLLVPLLRVPARVPGPAVRQVLS